MEVTWVSINRGMEKRCSVYVCVCIYICIYTCVHIYTYIYIYTYMYIHVYTHTHTHIYIDLLLFSCSVLSDSLQPHGLQHTRFPWPSPSPESCSNSYPLSRWCHPTISSSVVPFSSCPQSFPGSGSFQMSQLSTSCGQSIGVSASTSLLPMNTKDWFPLGWTGWISLQSKGLSRVFSNTTVQKLQFFSVQLYL